MWDDQTIMMLLEGTRDTLYMTLVSTFFGYVLGLPLGILLAVTDKEGIRPNAPLYKILDVIVNILRSIPFLILLILVIPLTKLIVGQSYGSSATIVPLVIAAAPFIARMVESSLKEVEPGVIEAAVKAIEAVDECVGKAYEALKEADGQMFICADHGNAEYMIDEETKEPFTAHTTNPVPFILVNADPAYKLKEGGCLADIAPTLIELMGMEQPAEMTGTSLLVK